MVIAVGAKPRVEVGVGVGVTGTECTRHTLSESLMAMMGMDARCLETDRAISPKPSSTTTMACAPILSARKHAAELTCIRWRWVEGEGGVGAPIEKEGGSGRAAAARRRAVGVVDGAGEARVRDRDRDARGADGGDAELGERE